MKTKLALITFGIISVQCIFANSSTWEQWRGPNRNGIVEDQSFEWPKNLKGIEKVWSKSLAEGYSSPIITEDRVFTVETKDKTYEITRAFDRKTGKQLWETSWEGAMKVPFFARKNGSWVRSTPVYDNGTLYVGGIRDVLVALDAKTGKEKWKIDFVKTEKSTVPTFGFVSSPVILGDHLYIRLELRWSNLNALTAKRYGEQ